MYDVLTVVATLSLALIPTTAYWLGKRLLPERVGLLTGTGVGLVVAPVSLGLYAIGMLLIPFGIGIVPMLIRLPLATVHGIPGMELMTTLGLRAEGTIVQGPQHTVMGLINGVFWGLVYGGVGWALDRHSLASRRRMQRDPTMSNREDR